MGAEHRNFFRLDVILPCSYQVLTREEAEKRRLPDKPTPDFIEHYFMNNLQDLNEQISELLVQVSNRSALIGTVLRALNSKIDFALEAIDTKQLTQMIPNRMVNISGNGLAIQIDQPITKEHVVDLLIKPLEDEEPVIVRCDVVNIKKQPNCDDCYWVALKYQYISEDDRRKLIYFLQQKEIETAQKARASSSSES